MSFALDRVDDGAARRLVGFAYWLVSGRRREDVASDDAESDVGGSPLTADGGDDVVRHLEDACATLARLHDAEVARIERIDAAGVRMIAVVVGVCVFTAFVAIRDETFVAAPWFPVCVSAAAVSIAYAALLLRARGHGSRRVEAVSGDEGAEPGLDVPRRLDRARLDLVPILGGMRELCAVKAGLLRRQKQFGYVAVITFFAAFILHPPRHSQHSADGATDEQLLPGLVDDHGIMKQTPEGGHLWDTEDPDAAGVRRR